MRVSRKTIAKGVATLDEIGLNNHVIVLFSGGFTANQKKRAKEHSTIRTQKVIEALKWLCSNHVRWQKVDYDSIVNNLREKQPKLYDRSYEVESINANLEKEELFTCYYPDGASTPSSGGFEDPKNFKKFVQDMAEKGFDVEFELNVQKEFCKESDHDLLLGDRKSVV